MNEGPLWQSYNSLSLNVFIIIMGSLKFDRWGMGISTVSMIISTILLISRQGFQEYGLNITSSFQSTHPSKTIITIFNIINLLGNFYFVIGVLAAVHLLTSRKLLSVVYLSYMIVNIYVVRVEKQFWQQARPYSYDYRIQSLDWSCPGIYSLPSGHGWFSILLYQPIISDLIGNNRGKKGLLLWIVMTGIMVPIASLQLGSHSIDQLLNGVLIGLAALMLYKCLLQTKLYELMVKTLRGDSIRRILFWNNALLLLSIIIPITIYTFNSEIRKEWTSFGLFLMNFTCDKEWTQDDIQQRTAMGASIIGVVFGFVYGFSAYNKFDIMIFGNTSIDMYIAYLRGNWTFKGKFLNVCKYILLYFFFTLILLAAFFSYHYNSFIAQYIKQTMVYCFLGFSISLLIPILLIKFKIIQIRTSTSEMQQINDETKQISTMKSEFVEQTQG